MLRHILWSAPALALMAAPLTAQEPRLLSAFFGLNDSRQILIRTAGVCRGFSGGDGMPVIFSHEVAPDTLDAEDFTITRASGAVTTAECVTLRPADDPGELRTALVIGQYGSTEDAPVSVEISGDVYSLDGALNFKGATADVTPLAHGPTMVLAETIAPNYWSLGGEGDCPRAGLRNIVRAVWAGGITKPGGAEIDEAQMQMYRVTLRQQDGTEITVTPMAVGDLGDNDNNHELCLDADGTPMTVSFPAGALTDPNEDLNPASEIAVTGAQKD